MTTTQLTTQALPDIVPNHTAAAYHVGFLKDREYDTVREAMRTDAEEEMR